MTRPPDPDRADATPKQADEVLRDFGEDGLDLDDAEPIEALDDDKPVKLFLRTDVGNGMRLVHWFGEDLRYSHELGTWFIWNGVVFAPDRTQRIRDYLYATVRRIDLEADEYLARAAVTADKGLRESLEDDADAMRKWRIQSEGSARLDNMAREAGAMLPIAIAAAQLDADAWLLPVANGVLDLRKCVLREPRREDLFTKQSPVVFDEGHRTPVFFETLERITCGDKVLALHIQKIAGLCLTGSTAEQKLFLFYGSGANGKTTLLNALSHVLGPFAHACPPTMLLTSAFEQHPTTRAALRGIRMAIASEVNTDGVFDEGLVKSLTGSDPITARFMRQDEFTFVPSHKFVYAVNHLPQVTGTDHGIWRRLEPIPFDAQIPADQQDKGLADKLAQEAPGILAWCVDGLRLLLRDGLGTCAAVQRAKARYVEESNPIAAFLDECVVLDAEASTSKKDLYKRFTHWCEQEGRARWSHKTFRERMLTHLQNVGVWTVSEARSGSARRWTGLRLRDGWE